MNKKSLVVLLVLILAISGLFAKDSGFKVGGQLGWGFDTARMKVDDGTESEEDISILKAKNNGFAFNLTGEYDFDKNWGVVANVGMMFAGKTTYVTEYEDGFEGSYFSEKAGLYIDFALDAKYTLPIDEKLSVAGLAGLELVAGYIANFESLGLETLGTGPSYKESDFYNVAFGLNLGLEGSYKVTDQISVVGGVTSSWFFVNSAKFVEVYKEIEHDDTISGIASFYIRPYLGATYSF